MSVVDEAKVESDECGFELLLTGDVTEAAERYLQDPEAATLRVRLSQDAAIQLCAQVRDQIGPWVEGMVFARASYDRAELIHAVLDDDDPHEEARVNADLSRKAVREGAIG